MRVSSSSASKSDSTPRRALDEEPYRVRSVGLVAGFGDGQGADSDDALTLDVEWLPTRRDESYLSTLAQDPFGDPRRGLEEMFAVVEDHECSSLAQRVAHALGEGNRGVWLHPERGRDDLHERFGVAGRCELAEPRTVPEVRQHHPGGLEREPGLADTSDPGERHEPRLLQDGRDSLHFVRAADEGGELRGEITGVGVEGTWRRE